MSFLFVLFVFSSLLASKEYLLHNLDYSCDSSIVRLSSSFLYQVIEDLLPSLLLGHYLSLNGWLLSLLLLVSLALMRLSLNAELPVVLLKVRVCVFALQIICVLSLYLVIFGQVELVCMLQELSLIHLYVLVVDWLLGLCQLLLQVLIFFIHYAIELFFRAILLLIALLLPLWLVTFMSFEPLSLSFPSWGSGATTATSLYIAIRFVFLLFLRSYLAALIPLFEVSLALGVLNRLLYLVCHQRLFNIYLSDFMGE